MSKGLQRDRVGGRHNTLNLELLPEVVQLHLCQFLNTSSILNLRLTCKSLKAVVDKPTILKRIHVKLRSSKQLQKILSSKVPFSSFILCFQSISEQSHFNSFCSTYGGCIRKLRVQSGTDGFDKILMLVQESTLLEDLELQVFLLDSVKTNLNVLQSFKNLKRLIIHRISGTSCSASLAKEEIQTFLQLLERCKNLTELKIPKMDGYCAKLELRYRLASSPLYLLQRIISVNVVRNDNLDDWEPAEAQEQLKDGYPEWDNKSDKDPLLHGVIDLIKSNRLKMLRQISLESVPFFEAKSFHDLMQICKSRNICLTEVNSTQFSRLSRDISSMGLEYFDLFESARVSHIHEQFPFSKMTNVKELHFVITPRNDHPGLVGDEDLDFPNLNILFVKFLFDVGEPRNRLLIRKIFQERQRNSVEKLHMDWVLENPNCETIQVRDLTNNFSNVRELRLNGWSSLTDDDCIQLWTGLGNLEKVMLQDCRNVSNHAFVGNYCLKDDENIPNRPLNRLKKLRDVHIRDISGKINQVAILGSFRWIPLRQLIFTSTVINSVDLNIYQAVVNSPLGRSAERFVIPRPKYRVPHLEKEIQKGFRNLRQSLFY